MQDTLHSGRVVRVTGRDVWVDVAGRRLTTVLRGRLRIKEARQVVAGDEVRVRAPDTGDTATIEGVEPRRSWLSRFVERDAGERVVVANVDTLFVVAAAASPPLHPAFVDRVLVSAEWGRVRAVVVINKMDLAEATVVDAFADLYTACGYEVLRASARSGDGVDALSARASTEIVAFVGESGVGKSSLLMRLDPNLDLKVREVGDRTGRGRHTTTNAELFAFREGYLADTPGMQTFGFPGNDPVALPDCFPEFEPYVGGCRFSPCSHSHEPGCAVKDALADGTVAQSRYDSYLSILAEIEARNERRAR